MTEIHHHYGDGSNVEVNHIQAAQSDLQASGLVANDGTPDADTKVSDIVQAAAVIAAAFIARNYEKYGEGRGQYKRSTIARISVEMAEQIHADVHATVHDTD